MAATGDPLVTLAIGNHEILLPVSHQLPLIRAAVPEYGENLVSIAQETSKRYPDLRAIDVGANVGDTAFLIAMNAPVPVLCIEGDGQFLPLLHRNVASLPDARVVEAYVGFTESAQSLAPDRAGGTARLLPDSTADAIELKPFREIVAEHPDFAGAKLLKIDTDGFDSRIIRSASDFIATAKPVLFFEYSPYWSQETGDPHPALALRVLEEAGYESVLVFKNTGTFLERLQVSDHESFDALVSSLGTPAPDRYFDICAFHSDDHDLGISVEARCA
jgi:FkbM family methyltransferase